MKEEILINATAREVRAAVVCDGVVQELLIERASRSSLLGNIYKGRVSRVLPGMQAAFVDIGLDKAAFLHASDIRVPGNSEVDGGRAPDIRQLVNEGDSLVVQVLKEPIGTKGARLTAFITIPSRCLVMLPGSPGVGISSRIEDDSARDRLRALMTEMVPAGAAHGWIVRTAAESAESMTLRDDFLFLQRVWGNIVNASARVSGVARLHADLPLAIRAIRDLAHHRVERVRVDSEECYLSMREFARQFMPELHDIIELYDGQRPVFDLYAIEEEIERALDKKIVLKSGGHLVIEQTEAMTTIDVNTGAYVGRSNLDETIFRTNLEAAAAIARQLRLRNLGGIIIIDFIDMLQANHREQVLQALATALASDSARNQISQVSPLGLVEMTRKRTRESLEHVLCEPCNVCSGHGHIKTPETVCYEIFREILRQHRQFPFGELVILAHDNVIGMLLDEESGTLAELEVLTGRPLRLQAQNMSTQDSFEVVPL